MTGDQGKIPAIEQISRRMKLVADVAIRSTPGKTPGWREMREGVGDLIKYQGGAMELSERA